MIGFRAVIVMVIFRFGMGDNSGNELGGLKDESKRIANLFPPSLKADIVFVIDTADDIGSGHFSTIKESLVNLVENSNIGPNQIQLSVVSFNSSVNTVFNLNQYHTNKDTVSAILNMDFYGGKSLISEAVSHAVNNNFKTGNGARIDAIKVLVIITGSVTNINSDVRNKILKEGVITTVIGTNCNLNRTELEKVAGNPKTVVSVTDFTSIHSFWKQLTNGLQRQIRSGMSLSLLYPYGEHSGDSKTVRGDDTGSTMETFLHPLKFFGRNYTTFYVSNNGLISLDTRFTGYSQSTFPYSSLKPLIALYWKDLMNVVGNVYYRQINRETSQLNTSNSTNIFQRVSIDVSRFSKTAFNASWMLITTWDKVQVRNDRNSILTFQCVIASSKTETYVIFNYKDIHDERSNYAQVGFNKDRTHFYNLKGARTVNVKSLNSSSNVGIPGQWIFRVDGENVQDNGAELTATSQTGLVESVNLKSDLQLHSPECVFHHNPTYAFCDCPHGTSGINCDVNVTTCLDVLKTIPHAFIRCGYDKDDDEERCFIQCQSGYQPSNAVLLNGIFICTSCKTQNLLSSNKTSICIPSASDVFG